MRASASAAIGERPAWPPRRSEVGTSTGSRARAEAVRSRSAGRPNVVERSIRPLALTRKNALFAGSDGGAIHRAVVASLIETCKLVAWSRKPTSPTLSLASSPATRTAVSTSSCPGPTRPRPPSGPWPENRLLGRSIWGELCLPGFALNHFGILAGVPAFCANSTGLSGSPQGRGRSRSRPSLCAVHVKLPRGCDDRNVDDLPTHSQ